MIHTIRTVAVGDQESKIDSPIILYRGDREVEVEFTINGSKFTFTNGGNVIKSTNATHGQLVINTPTGENMFSEVTECHDGKVVFVITKEMIDELIEVGFYSFQIRLFDESQVSRVTIPPVLKGIDIRNPIAAEDETNVVDIALVDYSVIVKDEFEDLSTFLPDGNYNKTEWESKDVISGAKLNKIEDALYNINSNMEAADLALLNRVENIDKTIHGEIDKLGNELESEVEEFERSLNNNVERFKIDTNVAMVTHKNEVSEQLEHNTSELEVLKNDYVYLEEEYYNTNNYDVAFVNCLNKLKEQGGGVLVLPNKTINLTEGLTINSNIHIKGSNKSKLYFSASSNSKCIQITNCKCLFENFNIAGDKSLTCLSLSNTIDEPVADSIFRNLRIDGFTVGIQSTYAWDISFYDTRIHNCTTVGDFGNQSNQIAFNNCRFSSFVDGFSFTNCEVITFRNCDFVNGTRLVYNLFQSHIAMYDSYIEHISKKFILGRYNERGYSSLLVHGGLITGTDKTFSINIQTKYGSLLSVKDISFEGFSLFVDDNTHIGQLGGFVLDDYKGTQKYELIKTYKGDSDITQTYDKIFSGNSLVTKIEDNYATITPDKWNGFVISKSLEIGQTYTVVINARTSYDYKIGQPDLQGSTLNLVGSGFKKIICPFIAQNSTVRIGEGAGLADTSIDIKEISFYKGIYSE